MVQPHLLLVQQRGKGARMCHGGEWWTYLYAAEETCGRRWKASGVVEAREGVMVVMKSEQEANGGGHPGDQPTDQTSLPPCETHPSNAKNSIKNQPFRTSSMLS
jgi:hypothetical protein